MKVLILKEDLDKVMPAVTRLVVSRGQLPVLSNVLIVAGKNVVTFSATNLELGVELSVGAKVEQEGSITVPAKNLAEFVALMSFGEVIIETDGEKLKVSGGKSKAVFAGISATEFPSMPKLLEKGTINIDKNKIGIIAGRVGYAASVDEARLVLTGIKFYKAGDKLRVVASDGFRLARLDVGEMGSDFPNNLIIPAKAIGELSKLIEGRKGSKIQMQILSENNQVVFLGEDFRLISRILDGNFPEVDKIIPTEYATTVVFDRKEVIEAVRSAAIFARENSNIVRFQIADGRCQIKAVGGQIGEEESVIEAEVTGDEVEIAFNFKYVLDLLNSMDSDRVNMMTNGSQAAVAFGMEGEESLVGIIMPVRV